MELNTSAIVDADDRTNFIPKHQGPTVLPNFTLFSRLLRFSHKAQRIVIRDVVAGIEATHIQLLTDVLHVRNTLQDVLEESVLRQLDNGEEVFVNLLSPGGYEFTVAFLAIVALGAVVVPLSPDLPVHEAVYYVKKSTAVTVLTASRCATKGKDLAEYISTSSKPSFQSILIQPLVGRPPLSPGEIYISSDYYLDINASGLVIFTSGTTGPPKGAVKRRGFLTEAAQAIVDAYELNRHDVLLHTLPVHHATGIGINLLPFLMCGGCVEFRTGSFDAGWMWERWKQGGLTFFSGVPTIYTRMMQYFEVHLASLPPDQLDGYVKGARQFRALLCGTSALPRPLQQKWTKLRDGKRIITRYGATEFGTGFMVPMAPGEVPETSVGMIPAGTELKLSNGDEGEVLIKSPSMFSKYLFDPSATMNAHDADGFFKTGDIAQRIGPYYYILGRASVDIVKSGGYKISALDIEREILGLPYVSEVMVVGVDDDEFGQRVAAAITLLDGDTNTGSLTLEQLRTDLRGTLAGYKMPTLLRVVSELPKTVTGKVMKKVLRPQMFPAEGHPDVQVWKRAGADAPRL